MAGRGGQCRCCQAHLAVAARPHERLGRWRRRGLWPFPPSSGGSGDATTPSSDRGAPALQHGGSVPLPPPAGGRADQAPPAGDGADARSMPSSMKRPRTVGGVATAVAGLHMVVGQKM